VEEVLAAQDARLHKIDLAGYAMHIDGQLVMVDQDLALINISRVPWRLLDTLKELKIKWVEVHHADNPRVANVLAVRPGKVLLAINNGDGTAERLVDHGVEVVPIDYSECQKNGGGIHCSTPPPRPAPDRRRSHRYAPARSWSFSLLAPWLPRRETQGKLRVTQERGRPHRVRSHLAPSHRQEDVRPAGLPHGARRGHGYLRSELPQPASPGRPNQPERALPPRRRYRARPPRIAPGISARSWPSPRWSLRREGMSRTSTPTAATSWGRRRDPSRRGFHGRPTSADPT